MAEEAISYRQSARAIGEQLGLSARSVTRVPEQPGLIDDIRQPTYSR